MYNDIFLLFTASKIKTLSKTALFYVTFCKSIKYPTESKKARTTQNRTVLQRLTVSPWFPYVCKKATERRKDGKQATERKQDGKTERKTATDRKRNGGTVSDTILQRAEVLSPECKKIF